MITESNLTTPGVYYDVKIRNKMTLFLGENQCFYQDKSDFV